MYNQNYLQQQSGDQSNNDHQQQPSQQQYQNSYPYGRNFGTPNSQGPVLQIQQSNSNLGQQQQSLDQQNYNNNAVPLSN
ncbi:unnamed protein product [[Candida] boidinii]|uniref:Unnamed protein product n=1 Tax=Candida boidinii TaxID=5477 RepID=A0A9W6WH33_CANBO|nr:unnamed protein product [[Candida] boidinii]